jgi:hypothetical protein
MALESDGLRVAGDVNIERVQIISGNGRAVDITGMVGEIQIFEDIFSPATTGTLAIGDSMDLVNLFPFVGEEKVSIKIRTPSMKDNLDANIDREFYVYKMTDRKIIGDRQVFYMLHFCSFELIADANVKLSKKYTGRIDQIAGTIIQKEGLKSKQEYQIEETTNSVTYLSNYWSPYKNLKFLADRAMNKHGAANYVFFENRKGLNFVSFDGIFAQQNKETYTFDNFAREVKPHTTIRNPEKDFSRFLDYNIETGFDYLDRVTSGLYGSKFITHDILTKKYSTKNYDMFKEWDKTNHLNQYPLSSPDTLVRTNSNVYSFPKYNSLFNGFGDDGSQNWLQRRASLMAQANAYRLTAEIPGRTDITIGQVIRVDLYKTAPIRKEDVDTDLMDQMFSGRYVISAINHRITREKHEIHMECIKDSLLVDPKTGKK